MVRSVYLSNLFLRLGLAAVFLWFGIDKFFHPTYWLTTWIPGWLIDFAKNFEVSGSNLVFLFGVFEVLVGVSALTGVFLRIFSFLSIVFLISIIIFFGINEVTVRDFAMIGGFLSLIFWPSRSARL